MADSPRDTPPTSLQPDQRIVVRTPDRREFRGRLLGVKEQGENRFVATVRLDSGWMTTYPLQMVHADLSDLQNG